MSIKQKAISAVTCSLVAILALVYQIDDELITSEQGLEHIAHKEGCRAKAYQCSAKAWTIGLGRTQGVEPGNVAVDKEIAEYFINDIKTAEQQLNPLLKRPAKQHEYDMMVSFIFNLGIGNFRRSTLLKKFNNGDSIGACNEYPRWRFVSGKDCRLASSNCAGIVTRREQEREICLHGY